MAMESLLVQLVEARPFERQAELKVAATEQVLKLAIASIQLGQSNSFLSLKLTVDFAQIGHFTPFTEL